MAYEQEVTVMDDVELIATYEWRRAEPDVGIMSPFLEDMTLWEVGPGRVWASNAESRMTYADWEDLENILLENHDED